MMNLVNLMIFKMTMMKREFIVNVSVTKLEIQQPDFWRKYLFFSFSPLILGCNTQKKYK